MEPTVGAGPRRCRQSTPSVSVALPDGPSDASTDRVPYCMSSKQSYRKRPSLASRNAFSPLSARIVFRRSFSMIPCACSIKVSWIRC